MLLSTPTMWTASASDGTGAVLTVLGELDIANTAEFVRRLEAMLDDADGGRLLVDLSRLEFMDSSGLHALIAMQRRCAERGVELHLRRGRRAVQRVFELTGTHVLFTFESRAA